MRLFALARSLFFSRALQESGMEATIVVDAPKVTCNYIVTDRRTMALRE